MVHFRQLALLALALPTAFSLAISNNGVDVAITPNKETNADRLAKGLGPLAPTRRSTAGKVKRSAISTGNTDPSLNDTTDPTKRYVIRLRNPASNTDMGVVTLPASSQGDLIDFDPNTSRAEKFAFGRDGAGVDFGNPFDISPMGDDGLFGGGSSRLLGAMPGRHSDGPDLSQGSPNYCHLGLTHQDATGLLSIHLPTSLLAHTPTTSDTDLLPGLTHLLDGTPLGSGDDATWPAQSGIWTFHDRSSRLLAHYVNSDGNTVPTYFVTGGACQHLICLTADVEAFRNAYGQDAAEVHALATVL